MGQWLTDKEREDRAERIHQATIRWQDVEFEHGRRLVQVGIDDKDRLILYVQARGENGLTPLVANSIPIQE